MGDGDQKLERARKLIEQDRLDDEYVERLYEEHKRQVAIETRFGKTSRADVLYMWEHACNEDGDLLTEFEFHALCEAWVRVFDFTPPDMNAEYDHNNPPPPIPSRRPRKDVARLQSSEIEDEPDDTMLSTSEVLRITGMSKSTFKRKRSAGEIPSPHQISERRIGWKVREIREVVRRMKDGRKGRH